jgi:hypothetical protein
MTLTETPTTESREDAAPDGSNDMQLPQAPASDAGGETVDAEKMGDGVAEVTVAKEKMEVDGAPQGRGNEKEVAEGDGAEENPAPAPAAEDGEGETGMEIDQAESKSKACSSSPSTSTRSLTHILFLHHPLIAAYLSPTLPSRFLSFFSSPLL